MAKAFMDFGLMVAAIIAGLILAKFAAKGIAATGLIRIAAGDALSQNPNAIAARRGVVSVQDERTIYQ